MTNLNDRVIVFILHFTPKRLAVNVFSHITRNYIRNCRHCPIFEKCHSVELDEKDYLNMSSKNFGTNICRFFMYKIYNISILPKKEEK